MAWQIIAIIAIGLGALFAFFAIGDHRRPRAQQRRKIQGSDVLRPLAPPRPADSETLRRFNDALDAQYHGSSTP